MNKQALQRHMDSQHEDEVEEAPVPRRTREELLEEELEVTSPDCNPLEYYFWNKVSKKVYEGKHCNPFKSEKRYEKELFRYGTVVQRT